MFYRLLRADKTPATQKVVKILKSRVDNEEGRYLTLDELINHLKTEGISLIYKDVSEKFSEFDTDKDGKLSLIEAIKLLNVLMKSNNPSKIFSIYIPLYEFICGLNKGGKVTYDSLENILNINELWVSLFESCKEPEQDDVYPIPCIHFLIDCYFSIFGDQWW